MKKIYLLTFTFLTVLSLSAQYKYSPAALGREAIKSLEAPRPQQNAEVADTRDLDIFYTNDFSNCNDWDLYNAFDEGNPAFVTGINFQCGTAVPAGPAAIAPIISTSAANGYMLVDSDIFGSETATAVENCWFQNTTAINCLSRDYVSIRFQTFYRMWDGGASDGNEVCLLEVSSDGVNWPDVNTFEVSEAPSGTRFELWPTMGTQDPVNNPTTFIFDISEIAANQQNVYLRFRWKGTYGYAWMIDDVELFVTPENDLTINTVYNGDILLDYEYTEIPVSQVTEIVGGAVLANYGYLNQASVAVTFDLDGTEYITIADDILPSSFDTIWSPPITVPAVVGPKTLTVTLPADDDVSGNSVSKTFQITQDEYSHVSAAPNIQRTLNDDGEVSFGCLFIINETVEAGGIKVWLGSLTDPNTEVEAFIYTVITNIQDMQYLGNSSPFSITQAQIDSDDYITIPFDVSGAVNLEAGVSYVVELRKYESTNRVYLVADGFDEDFSTVCYGPWGTNVADNWFSGWGFAPAIKLILDGTINVDEVISNNGVELSQNMPNPANANTTVNYTLTSPSNVQFIVRDMAGRIVSSESFGTRASGMHTIQVNTNQYSTGLYSYTLIAGETQLTKQMMIK